MTSRLIHPKRKIEDLRLRTDDNVGRLYRTFKTSILQHQERLLWRTDRLFSNSPLLRTKTLNDKLEQKNDNLYNYMKILINKKQGLLRELIVKLHTLNPEAILSRGYSITRTIPDATVVKDPKKLSIGQDLEVMVAKGAFICSVKRK